MTERPLGPLDTRAPGVTAPSIATPLVVTVIPCSSDAVCYSVPVYGHPVLGVEVIIVLLYSWAEPALYRGHHQKTDTHFI